MQSNWAYTRRSNIAARAWVISPGEEPEQTGAHKYCTGPDPFWMSRMTSNLRAALNSLPPRPSTASPPAPNRGFAVIHTGVRFSPRPVSPITIRYIILEPSRDDRRNVLHAVNNRRNASAGWAIYIYCDCHTRRYITLLHIYVLQGYHKECHHYSWDGKLPSAHHVWAPVGFNFISIF